MTVLGAFRDEDVPDVLTDMGVYVQVGRLAGMPAPTPGATPKGLLDENDQAIAADRGDLGVSAIPRTLVVQASLFTGVKIDDALVLTDQNDLTVRLEVFVSNRIKEGDAALTRFELRVVQ